jgi:ribosomal protein L21
MRPHLPPSATAVAQQINPFLRVASPLATSGQITTSTPAAPISAASVIAESTRDAAALFAVVYCTNLQFKVAQGDVFAVQRLRADVGSVIAMKKVMMVGGPRFTAIGRPFLENVRILCDVEENKAMRNQVYLRIPRGRRIVNWKDAPHQATILRVRSIEFEPQVVGELDKYAGSLIAQPEDSGFAASAAAVASGSWAESPNQRHWLQSDERLQMLQPEASSFQIISQ